MKPQDFREFVFTSTGKDTDMRDLGDIHDNLVAEVERLAALADLLMSVKHEELNPNTVSGAGQLLSDIRARMRAILDVGLDHARKR